MNILHFDVLSCSYTLVLYVHGGKGSFMFDDARLLVSCVLTLRGELHEAPMNGKYENRGRREGWGADGDDSIRTH